MNETDQIKKRFQKIKNLLINIQSITVEPVSLLGKTEDIISDGDDLVKSMDELDNIKIGIQTQKPDQSISKLLEILRKFNFKTQYEEVSSSVKLSFQDKEDSFDAIIYMSTSLDLLRWIYKYGIKSQYDYGDKICILKALADYQPLKINSWYDMSTVIVDTYKSYEFRPDWGLIEKLMSFKGKNGYLAKAKPLTGLVNIIETNPRKILQRLLHNSSAGYFQTVEQILEFIDSDEFEFKKRRSHILKRFKEYQSTKTRISFTVDDDFDF